MADPPDEQGGDLPPLPVPSWDRRLSICFGRSPRAVELFCTTIGDNFRRLLQARQDEQLKIVHRPQPTRPQLPYDIYDILPQPTRTLFYRPYYTCTKTGNRTELRVAVSTTDRYLPRPTAKMPKVRRGDNMAVFELGEPISDIVGIRFLASIIGNICERLPSHLNLGNIDGSLQRFIVATARRQAGQAIPLPAIVVLKSSEDKAAAVQTTVDVAYTPSVWLVPPQQAQSLSIELELERVPDSGEKLEVPAGFKLPVRKYQPASDTGGYGESAQDRAITVLTWISAHTHGRMFEEGSLDAYIEYLKGLACLDGRDDQHLPGLGRRYGGQDLFTISKTAASYTLSPSAHVAAQIILGHLPRICVIDNRAALFRVIECLETVYFATGEIESAWEAASHRADFEFEADQNGEVPHASRCTCTFPERPNTVHLCDLCGKSLLCEQNAAKASAVQILCVDCVNKPPQGINKGVATELKNDSKCHICFTHSMRCIFSTADQTKCDHCISNSNRCGPIKRDMGELPEKLKRNYSKIRERPDQPKTAPLQPLSSDDKTKKPPSQPKQPKQRKEPRPPMASKGARNLHKNWRDRWVEDSNKALASRTDREHENAKDWIAAHRSEFDWRIIENKWLVEGYWPDVYLQKPQAFNVSGKPVILSDDTETEFVVDEASCGEGQGPFQMVLDALDPLHVFDDMIINHAPANIYPTSAFLNDLRMYYTPSIIPLVALLCRQPSSDELKRISEKADHAYLISLQFTHSRAGRQTLVDEPSKIADVNRQHRQGIAEPSACLLIDRAWKLHDGTDRYANLTSSKKKKARRGDKAFDVARVERFIAELEEHYDQQLPRASGKERAVYLFHHANMPISWDWALLGRVYNQMLHTLTHACNRHYVTTCTRESLFALHCIQWMQRGDSMPWLIELLQPYPRHPFRGLPAHRVHGMQMNTGFNNEELSLAAFDDDIRNIDWEPHIINQMRGGHDHYKDRIFQKLQQDIPLDNPPFWSQDQVLGQPPDVPATRFSPSVTRKKSKRKKNDQTGSDGRAPNDQSRSSGFRTQSVAPVGQPDRGNLQNSNNVCYASSVVQVFANMPKLRALVQDANNLPFNIRTGRGDHGMHKIGDPGFVHHQEILKHLSNACAILDASNSIVPAKITLDLMDSIRKVDPQFVKNEEYDASTLFNRIMTILNDAGDKSAFLTDIFEDRPNRRLEKAQDQLIQGGLLLRPLDEELDDNRVAHRAIGNDSDADRATTIECVEESECTIPSCASPHSRSVHFMRTLVLRFPGADEEGYSPDRTYSTTELLHAWGQKSGQATCGHNEEHGLVNVAIRKVVSLPEVLVVQVTRLTVGVIDRAPGQTLENLAGFVGNPLTVDPILDLREFCERKLPTEDIYDTRLKVPSSRYRLRAVLRYSYHHFFTYALTPDATGTLHWAKFDDLRGRVQWESPFRAASEQTGQTFDFMLFYERIDENEDVAMADDKASTTDDSDEQEATEGDPFVISSDESSDMSDVADGSESVGAEASAESEEDSDFEDLFHDKERPEDDENFGYGPDDDDAASTNEFATLFHEHEDESDQGSASVSGEDIPSGKNSPKGMDPPDDGAPAGDDDDSVVDFEGLEPEAKAQTICDVFQRIAELLDGDMKTTLLLNADQMIVLGELLAEKYRTKEQHPEGKASPDSDVEITEEEGRERDLPIFKNMTASMQGIALAQGARLATDYLYQHHTDVVRELHVYLARALMLCKELDFERGETDLAEMEFFRDLPSHRGHRQGKRLGEYYRNAAHYLCHKEELFSSSCNMFLCGSYVTEMGWQLDDLQLAQAMHEETTTDLTQQNTALKNQVEQLQAQIRDFTIQKMEDTSAAPAKFDISSLSGPELYEHMQAVVRETGKFMQPTQAIGQGVSVPSQPVEPRTVEKDVEMTDADTAIQPEPETEPEPENAPMEVSSHVAQKIAEHAEPVLEAASSLFDMAVTPAVRQVKAKLPSFMQPTEAAAAKTRLPVLPKPAITPRPSTRAATRTGIRAGDRPEMRPETPPARAATSDEGQAAPETREEVHAGDRRRFGHVGASPTSPTTAARETPKKKLATESTKAAAADRGSPRGLGRGRGSGAAPKGRGRGVKK